MTQSLFSSPPLQQPPTPPAASASGQNQAPVSSLVPLTEDDLKKALPSHLRASVTQNMVDMLNNVSADPVIAEHIRDNFVGYSTVLKDGKFKTEDYINAVTYVSFKIMGHSNQDAYALTFPQRYAALLSKGSSQKDISAYVSAFHRGKLVNLIMEQSLVPTWVLNQDIQQKAINQLAMLMTTANSEKVQVEAAIGLLTHLKKPEPKGDFQINLNTAENSGMKEMRDMLGELAKQQKQLIEEGKMKTIDVAGSKLINRTGAEDIG